MEMLLQDSVLTVILAVSNVKILELLLNVLFVWMENIQQIQQTEEPAQIATQNVHFVMEDLPQNVQVVIVEIF